MKYLITGGAGYIGSTICSALEDAGHTPVILDSLITGREEFTRGRIFYKADIADEKAVTQTVQGASGYPGDGSLRSVDRGARIGFEPLRVLPG